MLYKKTVLFILFVFGLSSCNETIPNTIKYMRIPLKKINYMLQNDFPETQQSDFGVLTIEKPDIFSTKKKNKVRVVSSFILSNLLVPTGVKGEIFFSSGIRYSAQDRSVYLTHPVVEEIKIQNFTLSEYLSEEIQNVSKKVIAQILIEKPIYKIEKAGISFVKDIAIKNDYLIFHIGF